MLILLSRIRIVQFSFFAFLSFNSYFLDNYVLYAFSSSSSSSHQNHNLPLSIKFDWVIALNADSIELGEKKDKLIKLRRRILACFQVLAHIMNVKSKLILVCLVHLYAFKHLYCCPSLLQEIHRRKHQNMSNTLSEWRHSYVRSKVYWLNLWWK